MGSSEDLAFFYFFGFSFFLSFFFSWVFMTRLREFEYILERDIRRVVVDLIEGISETIRNPAFKKANSGLARDLTGL